MRKSLICFLYCGRQHAIRVNHLIKKRSSLLPKLLLILLMFEKILSLLKKYHFKKKASE